MPSKEQLSEVVSQIADLCAGIGVVMTFSMGTATLQGYEFAHGMIATEEESEVAIETGKASAIHFAGILTDSERRELCDKIMAAPEWGEPMAAGSTTVPALELHDGAQQASIQARIDIFKTKPFTPGKYEKLTGEMPPDLLQAKGGHNDAVEMIERGCTEEEFVLCSKPGYQELARYEYRSAKGTL